MEIFAWIYNIIILLLTGQYQAPMPAIEDAPIWRPIYQLHQSYVYGGISYADCIIFVFWMLLAIYTIRRTIAWNETYGER